MKSIDKIKADYHLFIDIQMGIYLKSVNKSEFSNDAEANLVIGQIVNAYNKFVASDHLRLNNLNPEAKATWFNSIEIDFQQNVSDVISDFDETFDDEFEKVSEFFYERFPFLPEGAMSVIFFVGPALEAYGLPLRRFQELMLGEDECTEIEEDLLLWAFDLTLSAMESVFAGSKSQRKKAYNEAINIAQEKLNEQEAIAVVKTIASNIKDFEKEMDN